jgi:parallel beta-helix repeat protein
MAFRDFIISNPFRLYCYPMIFLGVLGVNSNARTIEVKDMKSLMSACETALAGDEIVLAAGTYQIRNKSRIKIHQRPGPVMVRGATGIAADVIVSGRGQDDQSVEMIFELMDSPRWTFRDLTTRDSYYHGFKFDGSSTDCALLNVTMRDHGESGVKGTSDPAKKVYPDRLLVEKCDIGFTKETGGTRSVVEGIDGVAVKDWVIRNNRFLNIQKGGKPAYGAFTKGNSLGTIIEGNRFENCSIGASFGGGGTGAMFFRDADQSFEHRDGVIRNNTFTQCTDAAIYMNKSKDCAIEGNEMICCKSNIQLRFAETSGRVKGNVAKQSGDPVLKVRDGAIVLEDKENRLVKDP